MCVMYVSFGSTVFAITERIDMDLYEVPRSISDFGMGTMLANIHMRGIMLLLRAVLNIVKNASPRGPMGFRCLMFCLSGPCELLFLFVLLPLGPQLWSV